MEKIKTVLFDDEMSNNIVLENLLKKYCPLVEIVGIVTKRKEAVKLIKKLKPKLLFLDIEIDDGTGFDLLEELQLDFFKVIFITSHSEYAIKAFKYSAIDYVLKPIDIKK